MQQSLHFIYYNIVVLFLQMPISNNFSYLFKEEYHKKCLFALPICLQYVYVCHTFYQIHIFGISSNHLHVTYFGHIKYSY